MGIRLIYFSIIIIIYELQAKSSYLASFNLKLTNFEAIYITHYLIQKVKKMKNQEYLHKRSYLDAYSLRSIRCVSKEYRYPIRI